MTPVDILRKTRELLSEPVRWTRGAYARDASGADVPYDEQAATCWCLSGAVDLAGQGQSIAAARARDYIRVAIDSDDDSMVTIPTFNDDPGRTHADVLAAIDRAIALASEDK